MFVCATYGEQRAVEVFDCGQTTLDERLTRHAESAQAKRTAQVSVWTDEGDSVVLAYFTCRHPRSCPQTCHVVWRGGVPGRIPAVLLGKLALDRSLHGRGLGGQLLFDAYQRVLSATRTVAARYLAVDAIDTAAVGFYEHYGFIRAPVEPLMRLVRPIRDIQADIDAP